MFFSSRRKVVSDDAARTADGSSMPVERRQRMIGRPGLIAWQSGQSELLWLTSAGDGGPRRQLPGRYCQRDRTELCRWDSGTSEHRGGTVSALGRATSGDRAGAAWCVQNASLRRQVVRRRWGQCLRPCLDICHHMIPALTCNCHHFKISIILIVSRAPKKHTGTKITLPSDSSKNVALA